MSKRYRRFIKINGQLIASPEFETKKEANDWYDEQKRAREKVRQGRKSRSIPTFMEFAATFMKHLIADYEKPTWQGYESNLRIHLLPKLKDYRMDEISRAKCRDVLMDVVRGGYSINHRKHVQVVLSKIFVAAMNTEPPICEFNPVSRLTFEGKRQAPKFKPTFLETDKEVAAFLRAAKDVSDLHFVFACIGFMSALRRSEIIALSWGSIDWTTSQIRVESVYRAALGTITQSTKSGEHTFHDVLVPVELMDVLKEYRKRSKFSADSDFVLSKSDGRFWPARELHNLFDEIRKAAGRPDITIHSMRHTYGRLFTAKTGNTRALQAQLGHSTMAMTEKYSELSTNQVRPLAPLMGVRISEKSKKRDTKTTQMRRKS
jgi:integrase